MVGLRLISWLNQYASRRALTETEPLPLLDDQPERTCPPTQVRPIDYITKGLLTRS